MGDPPEAVERAEVVYAVDERYAVPLTVSLLSLQEHCLRPVPVLVLCDTVPDEVKAAVLAPLPSPHTVRFADVTADALPDWVSRGISARYSRVAYARLCVEEQAVAPRRFVYLDADTVVLRDVGELREVDLGGGTVGAVYDRTYSLFVSQTGRLPQSSPGASPRRFNSGVMAIDTKRWFGQRCGERALAASRQHQVMDQGGLNIVCEGDWVEINPEWNVTTQQLALSRRSSRQPTPAIRHLTSIKPWTRQLSARDRERWMLDDFYGYLRRTHAPSTIQDREGAPQP